MIECVEAVDTAADELKRERLKGEGAALRLDDMDFARAFVERMPEIDAERLVMACLERGRPRGLEARIWEVCRKRPKLWQALVRMVRDG